MSKNEKTGKARVDYTASFVKMTDDGREVWCKIGAAFKQSDGRVLVSLDSLPIQPWTGRVWLFPKDDKDAREEAEAKRTDQALERARSES